ncbi:hypothetical protein ACX8Z9_03335 [Arthrobacter halodurans]|uniref:Uncharacterized protein n=1 Tax=Arthrobacter halodurans TaxID=516699 RepID=A0ABV4UIS0_9MICC
MGADLELFHAASLSGWEKLRRLVPGVPEDLELHVIDAAREQLAGPAGESHAEHGIAAGTHVAFGNAFA